MRIQRKQNQFIASGGLQLCDCLSRKRMPITHRHKAVRIDSLAPQFMFQGARLAFSIRTDGRSASNAGIVMLHLAGTRSGNQLSEGSTTDSGEREVDNIGVAEEVIEERLDRFQRVGSAELKENYPHTPCCARHFPRNPRTRQCTPNRARESMAECTENAHGIDFPPLASSGLIPGCKARALHAS